MTKAFNLGQLANNVNSSGALDATTLNGIAPSAAKINAANFNIVQGTGTTKLVFQYVSGGTTTNIASLDSSGNLTLLANVTAYGTP